MIFLLIRFYQDGYSDGHAHGSLHGTFEGRRLGTEKGFEMWSEVGAMEAFARFWLLVLTRDRSTLTEGEAEIGTLDGQTAAPRKRAKQVQQLEALLNTTEALPMDNADTTLDIGAALERMRAKYKLACYSLGVAAEVGAVLSEHVQQSDAHTSLNMAAKSPTAFDDGSVVVKGRRIDQNQLHF